MRSTGIVLIFPKNRLLSGSNCMRNIFLLLTQAAHYEFIMYAFFFAHPLLSKMTDSMAVKVNYILDYNGDFILFDIIVH